VAYFSDRGTPAKPVFAVEASHTMAVEHDAVDGEGCDEEGTGEGVSSA
jgi:hypothetical protein